MTLEESDLKLLHDIANRRACLRAPLAPLLHGALTTAMRRRYELMAELARLEAQWLERGLACAGLPVANAPFTPLGQRAPRPHAGPDFHHF